MIELGPSMEAEMIAAFLQAEIHSKRRRLIEQLLSVCGLPRFAIETPDVRDPLANELRRWILSEYRGYPDRVLFAGFPEATWHRVRLEPHDFERMRYANFETALELSGPSRLVSDGARNFGASTHGAIGMSHIMDITAALIGGRQFPPLIAAQDTDDSLVLIEGHARATAYTMLRRTKGLEAFVARSPCLPHWKYY